MPCHYCQREFSVRRPRTTDHKIPKSRGGSNAPENRVEACGPCNWEKADLTEQEYVKFRHYRAWGLSVPVAWSLSRNDAEAPRNPHRNLSGASQVTADAAE